MLKIKEVIIVEGNYDKIKLSSLVDATIIVTDGFMIFKDTKMREMIRALAIKKGGAIIFTDSDSAGFKIRNLLKNTLKGVNGVKHAYIPDIKGKEKRKNHSSKEGFLGVEGVSDDVVITALQNAGYSESVGHLNDRIITKADLFCDGLSGSSQCDELRNALKKRLNLPKRISANMLLDVLNDMYSYDEYKALIEEIKNK